MFHQVPKHGKYSNQRKLHLNDPVPLLINIKQQYKSARSCWNLLEKDPCSISQDTWTGTWTHVLHLDVVDIDQNMSATSRLMVTYNSMKTFKLVDATAL